MLDDKTRIRSEEEIHHVIKRLLIWKAVMAGRMAARDLTIEDVKFIPSRMRCKEAFHTEAGKKAIAFERVAEKDLLTTHEKLGSRFFRIAYHYIKEQKSLVLSDMPVRLAQIAFELNFLNECAGDKPSQRVMDILGESSMADFEKVRGKVIDATFYRLQHLAMNVEGGLVNLRERNEGARSSLPFLNDIFVNATNSYAMEIQNGLEFAGYDFEAPDIVQQLLFPQPKHVVNSAVLGA